jgi:hypothetical protein
VQTGGFLADSEGNLIGLNGKKLTGLDELSSFLTDGKFNEFVDGLTKNKALMGILVMKIDDNKEEIISKELDEDLAEGAGQYENCDLADDCNCKCWNEERTIMIKSPSLPQEVVYQKGEDVVEEQEFVKEKLVPVPTPVYKKKIVPYEVEEKVPVYIKQCVPVHVPVKVPVKVPVRVEVPCYQEYQTVVPVRKDVYKVVPKIIDQERCVEERVPVYKDVCVPVPQKEIVEVPQPYEVIRKVPYTVQEVCVPSCSCECEPC